MLRLRFEPTMPALHLHQAMAETCIEFDAPALLLQLRQKPELKIEPGIGAGVETKALIPDTLAPQQAAFQTLRPEPLHTGLFQLSVALYPQHANPIELLTSLIPAETQTVVVEAQ